MRTQIFSLEMEKQQIVRDILGLDEMQEMSAMGGGAVAGYSVPLGSTKMIKKEILSMKSSRLFI
jgi:replicative DNA helicase